MSVDNEIEACVLVPWENQLWSDGVIEIVVTVMGDDISYQAWKKKTIRDMDRYLQSISNTFAKLMMTKELFSGYFLDQSLP